MGLDLAKAHLNMAWALPFRAAQMVSFVLGRFGLKKIDQLAKRILPGVKTAVQEKINRLIFKDLLELPVQPEKQQGEPDALLAEILDQPEIKGMFHYQRQSRSALPFCYSQPLL